MAKNPMEAPYMKKKEAKRHLEKRGEEQKKTFKKAERGWEETGQELEFEETIGKKVSKAKAEQKKRKEKFKKAEESKKKLEPKLKKMRKKILFGEKDKDVHEVKDEDIVSDEPVHPGIDKKFDFGGGELEEINPEEVFEEAQKTEAEIEKVKESLEEAGEFEAKKEKKGPKEPKEKVIVDMPELEEREKKEMKDLKELIKREEPEEVHELKKKKESSFAKASDDKEKVEAPEKLSLSELDDRVHALWGAMDAVLQDAAAYEFKPGEKKKIKKWAKKSGEVEEWPLDDTVTAENYEERLEKYGITKYIDPSKIKQHKDAYAVVSEQYKLYRDELEKRIRKAKLKQLEKLEEEEEETPKRKKKKESSFAKVSDDKKIPTTKEVIEMEAELPPKGAESPEEFKEKLEEMQEKLLDENLEAREKEAANLQKHEKEKESGWEEKEYKKLIKAAKSIRELKKTIQKIGPIRGILEEYDPEKLFEIIDKVAAREISGNRLTSKFGLRKKVKELMKRK